MGTFTGRLEDQDRDQLLQTARRLLAEADALSSRIAAVNEIGIAINQTLDLNAIERVVARQAKWLLDFDHCSVCLEQPNGWQLNTLFGTSEPPVEDLLTTPNLGKALKTRQPQLTRQGSESPVLAKYPSQLIIPLVAEQTVLGTINFASLKPACYTQDDMRIAYMLALQLASAIRNARNFEALTRARDELEARNQELDAFSHTIAHDLKSPLSNIILKSEILPLRFADILTPPVIDSIQNIRESGIRMNQMIDQLLWLARLRDIKAAAKPVAMDIVAAAAVLRFSHVLETISIEIAPELPAAIGHAQWVEEVFANLISNAIKYMGTANPAPRICIRGVLQESTGQVRYEVEDTGVGIAPDDQKRLFEMFTRLHTVKADGLGLGLSIVHRIVTRLGGSVGVESVLGQGSTFWFTLPAAPVMSAASETAPVSDAHTIPNAVTIRDHR
jgi:signal transduction histidine kinase